MPLVPIPSLSMVIGFLICWEKNLFMKRTLYLHRYSFLKVLYAPRVFLNLKSSSEPHYVRIGLSLGQEKKFTSLDSTFSPRNDSLWSLFFFKYLFFLLTSVLQSSTGSVRLGSEHSKS